jgi:hypothetical protein
LRSIADRSDPVRAFKLFIERELAVRRALGLPSEAYSFDLGHLIRRKSVRRSLFGIGYVMSDDKKTDLEQRIKECQQKIKELSLSKDDPKIKRIIRALQEQIALDSYRLLRCYLSQPSQA